MNNSTPVKIMDLTEAYIRRGGCNSFSFRDIATSLGLKSSSIHYHFATKDDLIVSVADRYVASFMERLEALNAGGYTAKQKLEMYVAGFREEMVMSDRPCLCGRLSAEQELLPPKAVEILRNYFEANLTWISERIAEYSKQGATSKIVYRKALKTLSMCHGGYLVARSLQNKDIFDEVIGNMGKLWLS